MAQCYRAPNCASSALMRCSTTSRRATGSAAGRPGKMSFSHASGFGRVAGLRQQFAINPRRIVRRRRLLSRLAKQLCRAFPIAQHPQPDVRHFDQQSRIVRMRPQSVRQEIQCRPGLLLNHFSSHRRGHPSFHSPFGEIVGDHAGTVQPEIARTGVGGDRQFQESRCRRGNRAAPTPGSSSARTRSLRASACHQEFRTSHLLLRSPGAIRSAAGRTPPAPRRLPATSQRAV